MTTIETTADTGRRVNAPSLPESVWDHGYEYMDLASQHGWGAIGSWGKDGWDLGDWPYMIIFYRGPSEATGNAWGVGQYIEGDLETKYYETRESFLGAMDRKAFDHWKFHTEQAPPNLPEKFEDLPEEFRGMTRF
ncbi:hypothetical protein ACX5K5_17355 (plasmid) [Glutamicibacter bergerei]